MDELSRLFLKFAFKDLEIAIRMISMLKAWKSGFGSIYKGLFIYKITIISMKHLENNIKFGNNWQYLACEHCNSLRFLHGKTKTFALSWQIVL
jgi:hypothetical protein